VTEGVERPREVLQKKLLCLGTAVAKPAGREAAQAVGVGDTADLVHEQWIAALEELKGIGPGSLRDRVTLPCHGG
jgi:hypothetical protein